VTRLTPKKKVCIVVPTYNRIHTTLQFIERLAKSSVPDKIYICDSESCDGTAGALASAPKITLVNAGFDAWWSGSVNSGIKLALADGADIVIIMNDDIIFESCLLRKLMRAHYENPFNIITPIQKTDSGNYAGTIYSSIFKRVKHLSKAPSDRLVDTSNGCCLLIPREVFQVVGSFDARNCPHLYGDTEFQLRARSAGFHTLVANNAIIQQMSPTNYLARLHQFPIFTHQGSPIHFRAYTTFGKTLYSGLLPFLLLGWHFHYDYMKVLTKIICTRVSRTIFSSP
jgi:GT2 family glycosyltransferase